jgi:low molecular weight protein-tyrosine phosphatase
MGLFRQPKPAILLVCTANICRSPMAEGILQRELEQRIELRGRFKLDSAGTHASQPGHAPDQRAQAVCSRQGINIGKIRSRQVQPEDFENFHHILAMDTRNHQSLLQACPRLFQSRVSLVTAWSPGLNSCDIPDPYYGNKEAFSKVFDLLQSALVSFVQSELTSRLPDNSTGIRPLTGLAEKNRFILICAKLCAIKGRVDLD